MSETCHFSLSVIIEDIFSVFKTSLSQAMIRNFICNSSLVFEKEKNVYYNYTGEKVVKTLVHAFFLYTGESDSSYDVNKNIMLDVIFK